MNSFPLERVRRRRRRHTPLEPPPSFMQARRDNAILIGVSLLMIVAGLLTGAGLTWWLLL
jgi:hypothetical protein